jgi:hypothetical protein
MIAAKLVSGSESEALSDVTSLPRCAERWRPYPAVWGTPGHPRPPETPSKSLLICSIL